ncbi:hypothetical protein BYT27DRAFT_7343052 [Phlegmacium glaucopus]|nr:hypothetical protein BYT27DRAFT_7343052 [Phlegmacium glaucopus]
MSTPAAVSLYRKEMPKLLSALPVGVREVIEKHAKEGFADSKEYRDPAGAFYSRYLCSLNPMPESILAGFHWMKKDPTAPALFNWTGTLKDWTIVDDGNVPTPLTNESMDYITDACMYPFFKEIPPSQMDNFLCTCPHPASLTFNSRRCDKLAPDRAPTSHIAAAVGRVFQASSLSIAPTPLPITEEQSKVEEQGEAGENEADVGWGGATTGPTDA